MSEINEKNENTLVPKPASAVEKAVPSAKRILSGMVPIFILRQKVGSKFIHKKLAL